MDLFAHRRSRLSKHSAVTLPLVVIIACMLGFVPAIVQAQPLKHRFTAVDLGTLGGQNSQAVSFGPNGDIVGWSDNGDGGRRGFHYADGIITELPPLGGSESWAYGINSAGLVVGSAATDDGKVYPTTCTNDVPAALQILGTGFGDANAVNAAGAIAGYAEDVNGNQHAWIVQNENVTMLPGLGGNESSAWDIADNGATVGAATSTLGQERAVLWANGMHYRPGHPRRTQRLRISAKRIRPGGRSCRDLGGHHACVSLAERRHDRSDSGCAVRDICV